jgi:hypothetical protein
MANYSEFLELGFPIIALFCFIALAASYFFEAGKVGMPSGMTNLFVMIVSAFLAVVAVFLAWGPTFMARLSVHLFLLGMSGIFGVATDKRSVKMFFVVFGAITTLCLIGSAAFLTSNAQISFVDISTAACNTYFNTVSSTRCKDNGYLMFLRVMGAIAIFATLAAIGAVLFSLEDASANNQQSNTHTKSPHHAILNSSRGTQLNSMYYV